MKVIWKRPDGYHGARPEDFRVVGLDGHSCIWLHKKDREQFPFRVSGGWEGGDATSVLNNLVNLLDRPESEWLSYLKSQFGHSDKSDPDTYFSGLTLWLGDLTKNVGGDTWEVEIVSQALKLTASKLESVKQAFITDS